MLPPLKHWTNTIVISLYMEVYTNTLSYDGIYCSCACLLFTQMTLQQHQMDLMLII